MSASPDTLPVVDLDTALDFAAANRRSILITLRRNGRPQSSNIFHVVSDGKLLISAIADRAKAINVGRDPRVSVHVLGPDFWSYVVIEGTATLTPVTTDPDDATADALVAYYRAAQGEHKDWAEYRTAMVREHRLVISVTPEHAYGRLPVS